MSRMSNGKIAAVLGVERNKKPLQNKVYKIEEVDSRDAGKIWVVEGRLGHERQDGSKSFHGRMWCHSGIYSTIGELKDWFIPIFGEKQWAKFKGQGKREFVLQRRVGGKNIKKKQ